MTAIEKLEIYLEGWRLGDGAHSLPATAPGFQYYDPDTGCIERDDFLKFVSDFKDAVAGINDGKIGTPFLTYTDMLISEHEGKAWCWWRATDTDFQGAAVIYFDETGVQSERIAYFTHLPD